MNKKLIKAYKYAEDMNLNVDVLRTTIFHVFREKINKDRLKDLIEILNKYGCEHTIYTYKELGKGMLCIHIYIYSFASYRNRLEIYKYIARFK